MTILQPKHTPWTDEDIKTLREMRAKGALTAEIVAALPGRSRSSILGKVFRLDIEKRPSPICREPKLPAKTKAANPNPSPPRRLSIPTPSRERQQTLADAAYMLALCREAGPSA